MPPLKAKCNNYLPASLFINFDQIHTPAIERISAAPLPPLPALGEGKLGGNKRAPRTN